MKDDLYRFHIVLQDCLREILARPEESPMIARCVVQVMRRELGGLRVPRMSQTDLRDSEIYELIAVKGLKADVAAERLGIDRSTVYRAYRRELERMRKYSCAA